MAKSFVAISVGAFLLLVLALFVSEASAVNENQILSRVAIENTDPYGGKDKTYQCIEKSNLYKLIRVKQTLIFIFSQCHWFCQSLWWK